uniref:Uncharacterized protein n=1 Tax=Heliothis virescens TaxID=7102 RepID=A0A2A4JKT8_HELVI
MFIIFLSSRSNSFKVAQVSGATQRCTTRAVAPWPRCQAHVLQSAAPGAARRRRPRARAARAARRTRASARRCAGSAWAAAPAPRPSPPEPRAARPTSSPTRRRWPPTCASTRRSSAPSRRRAGRARPRRTSALSAVAAAAADAAPAARAPHVWRRLHLDRQRLEQWNLNLRLWLHAHPAATGARAGRGGRGAGGGGAGGAGGRRQRRAPARRRSAHSALQSLAAAARLPRALRRPALRGATHPRAGAGRLPERVPLERPAAATGTRASRATRSCCCTCWPRTLDAQAAGRPAARAPSAPRTCRPPPRRRARALRAGAAPPAPRAATGRWRWARAGGAGARPQQPAARAAAVPGRRARADPPALRRLHLARRPLNMLWIIAASPTTRDTSRYSIYSSIKYQIL